MEYSELNERIKLVVEKAEELAISEVTNNIDFFPFFIYGENSNKIKRLMTEFIDDAIDLAEEEIANIEDETRTIVLTFKDEIDLKDGKFDAIVFQIYDDEEDDGYSFCQVYKIENNKMVLLNKKIFLGKIRNFLIF